MALSDKIAARIKVAAYKNEEKPDDRFSLAGEPFQQDENGRWFAVIPAHTVAYYKQLFPNYEFSEEFEQVDGESAPPKKAGRPRK